MPNVILIDTSGSMACAEGSRRRIDILADVLRLTQNVRGRR